MDKYLEHIGKDNQKQPQQIMYDNKQFTIINDSTFYSRKESD